MTEAEWLQCTYAADLLDHLRGADVRKLRLFACACCREGLVWRLLQRPSRYLVEVSERFAGDSTAAAELRAAAEAAPVGKLVMGTYTSTRRPNHLPLSSQAERAVIGSACPEAWEAALQSARMTQNLVGEGRLVGLVRDIFGNPFRRTIIGPASLNPTITSLARTIYDERAFERLPELADALENAGCTNADLLDHLRGSEPHVRGCWVVDLILGTR